MQIKTMVRFVPNCLAPFFLLVCTSAESECLILLSAHLDIMIFTYFDNSLTNRTIGICFAVTFTSIKPDEIVNHLRLGSTNSTIQIRNVTSSVYSCYALFANGHSAGKNPLTNEYLIPDKGVLLSTGEPIDFNENDSDETTTNFREDTGEPDLESQLPNGGKVFDQCYIQFQFQCPSVADETDGDDDTTIKFAYVFGSEEYGDDDVDAIDHNDIFGAFLNGQNIALLEDDTPVTINNINSQTNAKYFIENELADRIQTSPFPRIEADGFTTELQTSAKVLPGWNSLKLVVGDVGDGNLDSWALIKAGSFSCSTEKTSTVPTDSTPAVWEEKEDPANPTVSEEPTSRRIVIPMTMAVGLTVLLGLLALSLPIIGLTFYNKRMGKHDS